MTPQSTPKRNGATPFETANTQIGLLVGLLARQSVTSNPAPLTIGSAPAWPPGLTYRRPFILHPSSFILSYEHPMLVPQTWQR